MSLGLAAMSGREPKRLRAHCEISVNGKDVTSKFDPFLIKIRIIDKKGSADEAHIEVDDRYGRLKIPQLGEAVRIRLGWRDDALFTTFSGKIADVDHMGQKKQGRRMEWMCSGVSFTDKLKEPFKNTWEEKKAGEGIDLKTVITEAAKQSGVTDVKIDEKIGAIKMPSFIQSTESLFSFLRRLGYNHNFDAKFATQDGKNVLGIVPKDGTTNAQGQQMPTVKAIVGMWGVDANVIGWRIKPSSGRPQFQETASDFFNKSRAQWDEYIHKVSQGGGGWFQGGGGAGAAAGGSNTPKRWTDNTPNATEEGAKGTAQTSSSDARQRRAKGWIVIDGEPQAQAGGFVEVEGIRHGVDGKYKIDEAEHSFVKSGGFTTRLDITEGEIEGQMNDDLNRPTGPFTSGARSGGGSTAGGSNNPAGPGGPT
jgi:phage protein D